MSTTMRDVALRAGVSINTVSRVVNNYGEITEATRQRVMTAISELHFRPNTLARSLVSGKSLSVALIIPQITDPFFPDVALGIESIARQHGYSVFQCNTEDNAQQEMGYIDALAAKQIDGIIICGSRMDTEQLSKVSALHPLVIVGRSPQHNAAVISICHESGLFEITSHLIRLGHRVVGHVGCSVGSGVERTEGYRRALREHDVAVDERRVVFTSRGAIDDAREAARRLLIQSPEVTAVSCFNDLVAIGVMQACADLGRRVPDDVAVVGFDDIALASLVTPALTTMHVPRFHLGEMLMDLLLRVIADEGIHEEHLYVESELRGRDSCGARRSVAWSPAARENKERKSNGDPAAAAPLEP
jgi:DNA-binding LacI/PurR family transcriptional regulator